MKEIQLTKGAVALVDDEDFEHLNQFNWCLYNQYAGRKLRIHEGPRNAVRLLHHELLPDVIKGKIHVDHIDRNKLNNQRTNLRYCTHGQNLQNAERPSKLGLHGVRFIARNPKNPYQAYINIDSRHKHLGYFPTKELASAAYNAAAAADSPFRLLNEAA